MTVQPPDPLSMRAADADRHAVADILGTAYAEGRLSHAEYSERLDALMQTTTYGELVPFVVDLPGVDDQLPTPLKRDVVPVTNAAPTATRSYGKGKGPKVGSTVAVFGENKRRGSMVIGGQATVVAVFGETKLDMSQASFTVPEVSVTVNAVFGQSTLVVPADAVLTIGVVPILGAVKNPDDFEPTVKSASPLHITVHGVALFGEVRIERAYGPWPQTPPTGELSS